MSSKEKYVAVVCISLLLWAAPALSFQDRDTVSQISTIDALMNGLYDGWMSIGELKSYGDFGIGTFHALDGEMVMVDGTVYQVTSDGTVRVPDRSVTTPFAAVTFFDPDQEERLREGTEFHTFEKEADEMLGTVNLFYAMKIEGAFEKVRTRSVPRQSKPYPLLKDVAKTQPVFEFEEVEGVMVGFRCPPYVKGINVPGYHLHFLTKDGKGGGHVLDFTVQEAVLKIDTSPRFFMSLPEGSEFYEADLKPDRTDELKAIEK